MVAAASPRYEVVCRLAGGGMADLYLARSTGLAGFERLVVIKRLSQQLATQPQAIQALYDEARIAATLSHANIVQVNDVEIVDGQVSIVMEFLHGSDVARLMRRFAERGEPLPLDQALMIVLAVCAGLHHAHERVGADGRPLEIVHRDVSPHNVFVTYDGAVKVVDFGIARAVTRRNKTEAGVIKGKPGYIAPEQLRGKRVDRRTDVWATGVLLYELTTGTRPFGNEPGAMDQMLAVVTTDPPPPSSRVAGYPPALEAIVMRAMAREAAGRYPTAEALGVDLEAFASAQRLDLSPFRLGALMERAFAGELAAWRHSQEHGLSLEQHVAASASFEAIDVDTSVGTHASRPRTAVASHGDAPSGELVAPAREARRSRPWLAIAAGVVGIPIVVLAGIAAWSALSSSKRAAPPLAAPRVIEAAPPVEAMPARIYTPTISTAKPADSATSHAGEARTRDEPTAPVDPPRKATAPTVDDAREARDKRAAPVDPPRKATVEQARASEPVAKRRPARAVDAPARTKPPIRKTPPRAEPTIRPQPPEDDLDALLPR